MERLMTPADMGEALTELDDLRSHWERSAGPQEARRRYRKELRRYPARLIARRLFGVRPPETAPALRALARHVRSLARSPVLASAIVLTVGLGLAGCTAIFAVADVLFLRPLPYPGANRLVWIHTETPPYRFNFSVADFQALEAQQTTFARVAAFQPLSRTFVAGDVVERLSVWGVTPGFFEVLGVRASVGRTTRSEEGVPGAPATALVTTGFATTRMGAAPDDLERVLGTSIQLDDVPYEIVGVLPESIGPMGRRTQVFTTQQFETPTRRGPFFQIALGRLADEVDPSVAGEELRAISRRLFPMWQASYQDEEATWRIVPLAELLHGDVDRLILLLSGSVGLLLLLATTNAASLLLTRVRSRQRELSVRVALGASRARVLGHLLTESGLLALGGVLLGMLLAWATLRALPALAADYIPRVDEVALGGRSLAFAAALAALSWTFFGVLSAIRGSAEAPLSGLKDGGRSATPGRSAQGSQRFLVAAQVAVAVPLLVGATLVAASMRNLQRAEPGFETEGLLTLRVSLASGRYADGPERQQFWRELQQSVGALPGVRSVGIADSRPPVEAFNYNNYDLEDLPTPAGENQPVACWVSADEGYLETLGIPLLEGRMLTRDDELPDAPPVILVDERWARRHFPGESAVGRRLREGGATSGPWTTVVGVVGEVPYAGFAGDTGGTVYAPWTGLAQPFVVVRSEQGAAATVDAIRGVLTLLDPTAPVTDVATGEALMDSSFAEPRHLTLILLMFGGVALALAVVGVYGITAHAVESRKGDIAVRLALGGPPRRVLGMIVRGSMAITLAGLLVGALAARGFTPLLAGRLFDIDPADPATLSGVVALLGAISLVACAVPAWRAVRLDPRATLNGE
jgi:predicted permease